MADNTKIEWTHQPGTKGCTWNPIRAENTETGKIGWYCEHESHACDFCYAEAKNCNTFFGNGLPYKPKTPVRVFLDEKAVVQPLRWRVPRTIFVCSMTDLFGRWVKDEWIDRIFAIAALCPQHTFVILTKRPRRMQHYVRYLCNRDDFVADAGLELNGWPKNAHPDRTAEKRMSIMAKVRNPESPLPNVWLGVTAEDQPNADARIPFLLDTPAALRFVSIEPMVGPVDLYNGDPDPRLGGHQARHTFIGDWWEPGDNPKGPSRHGLDWVICGGESGKDARAIHPDWARSLRDQCAAAEVPFFFKQWGEWAPHKPLPGGDLGADVRAGRVTTVHPTGESDVEVFKRTGGRSTISGSRYMARVGKKTAGRTLDGRTHDAFPSI